MTGLILVYGKLVGCPITARDLCNSQEIGLAAMLREDRFLHGGSLVSVRIGLK